MLTNCVDYRIDGQFDLYPLAGGHITKLGFVLLDFVISDDEYVFCARLIGILHLGLEASSANIGFSLEKYVFFSEIDMTILQPGGQFVKSKRGSKSCRAALAVPTAFLLLSEGLAVGALAFGGVHLVGAHQDLIQRAEVFVAAMVGALSDGALDTLVGMTIHIKDLLLIIFIL